MKGVTRTPAGCWTSDLDAGDLLIVPAGWWYEPWCEEKLLAVQWEFSRQGEPDGSSAESVYRCGGSLPLFHQNGFHALELQGFLNVKQWSVEASGVLKAPEGCCFTPPHTMVQIRQQRRDCHISLRSHHHG